MFGSSTESKFDASIRRRHSIATMKNPELNKGENSDQFSSFGSNLRPPLHPFLHQVWEALGVSTIQIMLNSIAMLVEFMVICYQVGINPSIRLLNHLVNVKTTKKEGHYYFQSLDSFKFVSSTPDSNKDWKDKFMWVFGVDPILSYPTWPEIKKNMLKSSLLLAKERQNINKIWAYAGSQEISNLFKLVVSQVVDISRLSQTEVYTTLAAILALPLKESEGANSALMNQSSTKRPQNG
uniref:Transposase (putative) gypsy type domain-containing protein n=1 Tax=Asparagus officinalis TaxID=4686 RepID=Q2XNT1_ASPOF|nr:hypothetical protein 12.t00003 [Asparagus officinalis]ABB55341.1 hypothetical protein 9.t00002 [Asparagus officinalis]